MWDAKSNCGHLWEVPSGTPTECHTLPWALRRSQEQGSHSPFLMGLAEGKYRMQINREDVIEIPEEIGRVHRS